MSDVDQWLCELRERADRRRQRGRRRSCSTRRASGATWSRSPGTSRPSRGRDGVEAMLDAHARARGPRGWRTTEPPDTRPTASPTAWIAFETEAGRGNGLLRLRDGKAWTLLTALYELKGHEEPQGHAPAEGRGARRARDRATWLEARQQEAEALGYASSPRS